MVAEFEIPGLYGTRLRSSVLAPLVEPFVLSMTRSKYAQVSVHRYVAALAHLASWMTKRRINLDQLDLALIEQFIRKHVPHCRCRSPANCVVTDLRAAGRRLIVVGRSAGVLPLPASRFPPELVAELQSFDHYLDRVRGLALSTRVSRRRMIGDFLDWCSALGSANLAGIAVSDVRRFLTLRLSGCSPGKAAVLAVALRSYLRFRAFCGQPRDDLLAAMPTVARWPLDRLPSVLGEDVIAAVERSFDLCTDGGLRDYAMFRLMLDMGLRLSEVAHLQLDDLDWRAGTLRISSGKSRRVALLPLGREVAQAILAYLRNARPAVAYRGLFARKRAPFDRPITLNCVRAAMRQAYARAGHGELSARTHVLRHTAASRMLRAGVPIKRIADVLRHRCLDTTAIYAKVDTVRLAAVALPWPGSRP